VSEDQLQAYLALNWVPKVDRLDDGTFCLTVPPLRDLEVFGASETDVLADWRSALASHLKAYLAVGKVIPTPRPLWGEPSFGGVGASEASPATLQVG